MLHPLRAAARFIDRKIGWNVVGLALSLAIIVSACVVLYRILRGIELADRDGGAEGERDRRTSCWRHCSSPPAISR